MTDLNTNLQENNTCYGCPRLSGDVIKKESTKQTFIQFFCLAPINNIPERKPRKVIMVPTLSLDNKLPKPEEYPTRCENWKELASINTADKYRKKEMTKEDIQDNDSED